MKFRLYSLTALLLAASAAVTVSAQDYDDDIYYNPSKAKPQSKPQPSTTYGAGSTTYYGGNPCGHSAATQQRSTLRQPETLNIPAISSDSTTPM